MIFTICACVLLAEPRMEYVPVSGVPTWEWKVLKEEDPKEYKRLTEVRFAGETWGYNSVVNDPPIPGAFERIYLNMTSRRERHRGPWTDVHIAFGSLQPQTVFPVYDRIYRFNGIETRKGLEFEDVTDKMPEPCRIDWHEVCLVHNDSREFGRKLCVRIGLCAWVVPKVGNDKEWVAVVHWLTPIQNRWMYKREYGQHVGVGDLLKIGDGASLKVTKIVPPAPIEGVGNPVGWVCFEDVELAEERKKLETVGTK